MIVAVPTREIVTVLPLVAPRTASITPEAVVLVVMPLLFVTVSGFVPPALSQSAANEGVRPKKAKNTPTQENSAIFRVQTFPIPPRIQGGESQLHLAQVNDYNEYTDFISVFSI
ncbi:MAG: hypothetical protein PW734_02805 [Verrucomicrobium sp.]|nr:hypothetical protein [Verrucomicrobium sp.]